MRRTFIFACALMTLCAASVVQMVERGFAWLFTVFPASPPRIAFAGEPVQAEVFGGFADPHVTRHEAGMSRRAAMRGI
jgi:hypothetical protein